MKEKNKINIDETDIDFIQSISVFGILIISFVLTLIFVLRKPKVVKKKKSGEI